MRYAPLILLLAACDGCGNNNSHADALVLPNDACGGDVYFTGEVVDWDETETNFCGVFNATLTVHADPARTDKTSPNGRFELCLAHAATTQLDLTPPTGASMCSTGGLYQLPGIVVANQQVINTGKAFSARMIGMGRLVPFFESLGVVYDPNKATVFVHVEGTAHPVTSSGAHDQALAWSGTAWAAGDTGVNVLLPNLDAAGGTTTIDVTGGTAIGTGAVPIAAGSITYLTIVGS